MDTVRISEFPDHVDEEVVVRGWLYNKRSSGKLRFLIVRDGSGYAQVVVSKKAVPPDTPMAERGNMEEKIPATAANAAPIAQAMAKILPALMPCAIAASWSKAVARIATP